METSKQRTNVTQGSEVPAQLNLKSAILRYNNGDDRFQITLNINTRQFNFNRLVTESTSTVLERVKTNLSKKLRNFDSETMPISLVIGTEQFTSTSVDPFPIAAIVVAVAANEAVTIRIGGEELQVTLNPPEVTSIKFFNQCLVGLPLLPVKIEGSSNLLLNTSEFIWESRPGDENLGLKPRVRKPSKEVWTQRSTGKLVFVPSDSDVHSYLRFTCIPSDGIRTGEPLTVELMPAIIPPPKGTFLFKERLKAMKPLPESSNAFRVLSYNTLCELLTTPEWFKASPAEALETDFRLPLVNAELCAYRSDILCLQEIEQKHFERHFSPFLSEEAGLQGILSLKAGEDAYEGIATFYNPLKFRHLETKTIHIREKIKELPFYSLLALVPGLVERLEERNTVLQVVILEHIASGQILVVGNTHLYFKPDADHIRLLQTITCLKHLEEILQDAKDKFADRKVSVLFCGDFNCTPPFASYRLVTSGKIEDTDPDWSSHETEKIANISFQHNLNLMTAFPAEELTTIVINFEGCIDYIFYQPSALDLLQRHSPLPKSQIAALAGLPEDQLSLPNFQAPSDHLPIIADFSIRVGS